MAWEAALQVAYHGPCRWQHRSWRGRNATLSVMKLPRSHWLRQRGLSLLSLIILFGLFLLFIGLIAFVLIKAARKIDKKHPRPTPEQIGYQILEWQNEIHDDIPLAYIAHTSYALEERLVFEPFTPADVETVVEHSTNLVDWTVVAILAPGETFVEPDWATNSHGFYRQTPRDVEPTKTSRK
jgi:hypothetical protein